MMSQNNLENIHLHRKITGFLHIHRYACLYMCMNMHIYIFSCIPVYTEFTCAIESVLCSLVNMLSKPDIHIPLEACSVRTSPSLAVTHHEATSEQTSSRFFPSFFLIHKYYI